MSSGLFLYPVLTDTVLPWFSSEEAAAVVLLLVVLYMIVWVERRQSHWQFPVAPGNPL